MNLARRFTHVRAPGPRPSIRVVPKTGPLRVLQGTRSLVLLDVENIRFGARDLGLQPLWGKLASRLCRATRNCALHAFFSRWPGDEAAVEHFRRRGWTPHPYDIQVVKTYRGTERLANSDPLILFTAGSLLSRTDPDVVIIASGDGALVCDLAAFVSAMHRRRLVVTLSLAGSTSWRVDARRNPLIGANIELGQDCLQPKIDRFNKTSGRTKEPHHANWT